MCASYLSSILNGSTLVLQGCADLIGHEVHLTADELRLTGRWFVTPFVADLSYCSPRRSSRQKPSATAFRQ
jgi:hypothetical protein